jgi:hypothetical protein
MAPEIERCGGRNDAQRRENENHFDGACGVGRTGSAGGTTTAGGVLAGFAGRGGKYQCRTWVKCTAVPCGISTDIFAVGTVAAAGAVELGTAVDATTGADAAGVDPGRAVGVDPFGTAGTTPTEPVGSWARAARAAPRTISATPTIRVSHHFHGIVGTLRNEDCATSQPPNPITSSIGRRWSPPLPFS